MTKILVKNTCNDVGIGAFYHSPSYSPHSHTLPFEPYVGEVQLKLNEQAMIDLSLILKHLDYFNELKGARIISFTLPVCQEDLPKEDIKKEEEKIVIEKPQKKESIRADANLEEIKFEEESTSKNVFNKIGKKKH